MLHVLIIDDHRDQRELIHFLLTKYNPSWQIKEAENGKEALDIFLKEPVDFIITDVKMPFVTGIEFAEAVRKQNSQVPILFISGYDQFDFVKKALTLQAVNYILKPINPSEFTQQLEAMTLMLEERKLADQKEQKVNRLIIKENLTKLLHGYSLTQFTPKEQLQLEPVLENIHYLIVFDLLQHQAQQLNQDIQLLEDLTKKPVIQVSASRFVLFIQATSDIQAYYAKQEIHNAFILQTNEKVSSYLSQAILPAHTLYTAYTELSQSITQQFYNTSKKPNQAVLLPTRTPVAELQYFQKLTESIQKNQFDELKTILQQTLEAYQTAAYEAPTIVKFFFANVYKHILDEANIEIKHWQKVIKDILETAEYSQLALIFEPLLVTLSQREALIEANTNDYIREIKEHVFNYYADELSLETIAREVNITPKYLSELFIKEEGIGISKFIKEVRLNKAKELLSKTNKRIVDISKETGFNNHSYFIKIFRETFGMTPDNYRKSKRR